MVAGLVPSAGPGEDEIVIVDFDAETAGAWKEIMAVAVNEILSVTSSAVKVTSSAFGSLTSNTACPRLFVVGPPGDEMTAFVDDAVSVTVLPATGLTPSA